jgi:hypothetical protein
MAELIEVLCIALPVTDGALHCGDDFGSRNTLSQPLFMCRRDVWLLEYGTLYVAFGYRRLFFVRVLHPILGCATRGRQD